MWHREFSFLTRDRTHAPHRELGVLTTRPLGKSQRLSFLNVFWGRGRCECGLGCLTLHDPLDCGLSGSSVGGISQARIRSGFATSFSNREERTCYIFPRT